VTKEALWQSLAAVVPAGTLPVGITLAQVMNTWVDQPGYPVITATRNYETKAINFQQVGKQNLYIIHVCIIV